MKRIDKDPIILHRYLGLTQKQYDKVLRMQRPWERSVSETLRRIITKIKEE